MTLDEVRTTGLQALAQVLPPSDVIRFLQIWGHGSGDYTAERGAQPDEGSVQDLAEEIIRARPAAGSG